MSNKRSVLGFDDDDDSDVEWQPTEQTPIVKRPKLNLEAIAKQVKSLSTDKESDSGDDADYLNIIIQEDETSKPQKLEKNNHKTPTPYRFEDTTHKSLKQSTSLFGELQSHTTDHMVKLPNNQPKTKSKGLSIMEKMGFKIGETLGKDLQNSSALLEPIIAIPKVSRSGIGQSKKEKRNFIQSEGITPEDEHNYRNRLNEEQNEKRTEKMYHVMQKYCYEMSSDSDGDIEKLNLLDINVLWRSYVKFIQQLLKKKREKQFEETVESKEKDDDQKEEESDEELEMFEQLELSEKIERLNLHLRSEYYYCYYCGVKYEDTTDLMENCPGETEEDHK